MPWQAVYDEFCVRNNVPVGADFIQVIDQYVVDVTSKRG
jgi:L-rhamnose isomerase